MCVCVRNVHDVSAQESLCMCYCILFFFGTHYSECVCVVCDEYGVQNNAQVCAFMHMYGL